METESDAVKIWNIKLRALVVVAIMIVTVAAQIQGHDGALLLGAIAAAVSVAGVKLTNGIIKKVKP